MKHTSTVQRIKDLRKELVTIVTEYRSCEDKELKECLKFDGTNVKRELDREICKMIMEKQFYTHYFRG